MWNSNRMAIGDPVWSLRRSDANALSLLEMPNLDSRFLRWSQEARELLVISDIVSNSIFIPKNVALRIAKQYLLTPNANLLTSEVIFMFKLEAIETRMHTSPRPLVEELISILDGLQKLPTSLRNCPLAMKKAKEVYDIADSLFLLWKWTDEIRWLLNEKVLWRSRKKNR